MSDEHKRSGLAIGTIAFAAIMLIIAGFLQALEGIAAIANSDSKIFVLTQDKTYWLHLDTTQWGWLHLIVGIIIIVAGVGVMYGAVWARGVGVVVAALSIVVNFAFIPIYPVWAIVLIAIGVLVIWALTFHGRDLAPGS